MCIGQIPIIPPAGDASLDTGLQLRRTFYGAFVAFLGYFDEFVFVVAGVIRSKNVFNDLQGTRKLEEVFR